MFKKNLKNLCVLRELRVKPLDLTLNFLEKIQNLMNSDNKNALTGMLLIVAILMGWNYLNAPSEAQLQAQKRVSDSTATVQRMADSLQKVQAQAPPQAPAVNPIQQPQGAPTAGMPAPVTPQEQLMVIENQDLAITFTSKGGRIKQVLMKNLKNCKTTPIEKRNICRFICWKMPKITLVSSFRRTVMATFRPKVYFLPPQYRATLCGFRQLWRTA